jgi:hypothetical protein
MLRWALANASRAVRLAAAFAALSTAAIGADDQAPETVDDAIAALEKADPGSPEALNDRLKYAEFLIDAKDVDCHQRLDAAQAQLDAVAGTPEIDVVLPIGRARVADVQYRMHLGRASCGAEPPQRESELRDALAAAQQATGLYRDALDYQSMAVMQFNEAVTRRMSGDDTGAVAALESAIAMDREFGFRQDAEDNYKLLGLWKGRVNATVPATAAPEVTGPEATGPETTAPAPNSSLQDFPSRATTLKFAWHAAEATVGIEIDHTSVPDGKLAHGRAYRLFKQHLQAAHDGWVVSYEPGQIVYDVAAWPSETHDLHRLAISFSRALQLPGIEVSTKGDFKRVVNPGGISSNQSTAVQALILDHASFGEGASHLPTWLVYETKIEFGPYVVEQNAAEDYSFQTGAWIGATLEQGVWYNMVAPLALPGARQLELLNDVEFAYTRDVPCTATSTDRSCVEIVVHATPQRGAVTALLNYANRAFAGRHSVTAHLWSTTYMRIVTDPNTLTTYVYDVRSYWHLTDEIPSVNNADNHSERLVATFTYPRD